MHDLKLTEQSYCCTVVILPVGPWVDCTGVHYYYTFDFSVLQYNHSATVLRVRVLSVTGTVALFNRLHYRYCSSAYLYIAPGLVLYY